ncbi:hypothetical protein [Actinomadura nitritigenes]|uniref:hypothetical protein n=1 Tax=Actinomadura nitritigenes TaxID=134602 RepID=UPI003D8DBA53
MAQGEIFVQLAVNMADDPKMRALVRFGRTARQARDLYVQMILYCRENLSDGLVPDDQLGILAFPDSPAVGRKDAERLAEVGLIERTESGWYVPAFLKRNPSRAEVRADVEQKARGGLRGNHNRWHVRRGIADPDCPLCAEEAEPPGESAPEPPDDGSEDRSRNGNDDEQNDVLNEAGRGRGETGTGSDVAKTGDAPQSTQASQGHPDRSSDRGSDLDRGSTESPETETETETETYTQESSTPGERGRAIARADAAPPSAEPPRPDGLTSQVPAAGAATAATAALMSRTSGRGRRGRPASARPPRRDALSPLPEDFGLTDAMRRWAISTFGESLDLDFETEQFTSYFRSTGDRRRSWPDAWQKWIRDSAKRAAERARRPPPAGRSGGTDQRLSEHADLIRRLAGEEGSP